MEWTDVPGINMKLKMEFAWLFKRVKNETGSDDYLSGSENCPLNHECYLRGQCGGNFNDEITPSLVKANDSYSCLQKCKLDPQCLWFTYSKGICAKVDKCLWKKNEDLDEDYEIGNRYCDSG